jgi:hypothetical protein
MAMRSFRRAFIVATSSALTVMALSRCTSFAEDATSQGDGGPDAATASSSDAPASSSDGATDASPANVLPNGGFTQGCSMWSPIKGTASAEPAGLDGGACKVCVTGAEQTYVTLNAVLTGGVSDQLGQWTAEIFVRSTTTTQHSVGMTIRTYDTTPGSWRERVDGPDTPVGDWEKKSVTLKTTVATKYFELYIALNDPAADACIVVDEARLFRTP